MRLLADKVVLIVGAAGGIGKALCKRCSEEGAIVVAADIAFAPGRDDLLEFDLDVTDDERVVQRVAEIEQRLGRIDIVYNCAAILGRIDAVPDVSMDTWRRVFDVNLFGTVRVCRAVLPGMLARGGGRIINTASGAHIENHEGQSPYNASKAAVVSFTKTIVKEYHMNNIRANCIDPNGVNTEMIRRFMAEDVTGRPMAEKLQRYFRASFDLGYWSDPDTVVGPYVFLGCHLSDNVSGQLLRCASIDDPGLHAA